jgi:hypothetical protein
LQRCGEAKVKELLSLMEPSEATQGGEPLCLLRVGLIKAV